MCSDTSFEVFLSVKTFILNNERCFRQAYFRSDVVQSSALTEQILHCGIVS